MAFDFSTQVTRPYINRTADGFEQEAITYSANQPFYFSCRFKADWDGNDDKYLMSLQNDNVDGNVFNYGIYQNRLTTWSGTYDTGTLTFQNITRKLDLIYDGTTLKVYLDNQLVNSRSLLVGAATFVRIGEYHNYASADSWRGELWDWMFVIGTGEFVSPRGFLYVSDGTSYTTIGDSLPVNPFGANPFKYRSIYTHGYVSGGYKDTSPWRNVNRTVHSTDTTTNLGDIMDQAAAYTDGSYNDLYQYIYATSASWPGTGSYTSSISMVTETGRTNQSSWNLTQNMTQYGDVGVVINSNLTMAWIIGNQTQFDKHNLVTETMYAAGTGGSGGTPGDFIAAWYGERYGWIKHSYEGNRNLKLEFATETWSAGGLNVGTDGWGKALPTKDGYAYVKNVGNIGTSAYKINDNTGSNIRTDLNFNNAGEENYETGQNWGYCLGEYNGAQNNNTYKVTHGTDTYTVLGSGAQPKGHDGMSSAATATASVTFAGSLF
jgi:hypothetical protein